MSDIDRRIAKEVMGEPEPSDPPPSMFARSAQYNWRGRWTGTDYHNPTYEWVPLPFSEYLDYAMKAAEHLLTINDTLRVRWAHVSHEYSWEACVEFVNGEYSEEAGGNTLPEAICKLLLEMKEER